MTVREQIEKLIPPTREGWCTVEKGEVLYNLVQRVQPDVVVEIGTFSGRSTHVFAYALKQLGRGGIVFGIDPWHVGPCLEGTNSEANNQWWSGVPWEKVIKEYFDYLINFDLLANHSYFRKHDLDCLRYFADASIDLVHFDSNHSEEVACRTVHSWWGKLKPGAVIVMDDIDWEGQAKAVDVLRDYGCTLIQSFDSYAIYQKPQ